MIQGAWAQNFDVWDGVSYSKPTHVFYYWKGLYSYPEVHVYTAAEMAWVMKYFINVYFSCPCNHGHLSQRNNHANYILHADFDMTAAEWIPLGWGEDDRFIYDGESFNGNGHTIRIKISEGSHNYQGLFYEIAEGSKVENLHVEGTIKCNTRFVGGIAGVNCGTISNCWVSADVSSTWTGAGQTKIGGIVGENNGGTIEYCCMTGTVSNKDDAVGGIAGSNYWSGKIKHCTFYGNLDIAEGMWNDNKWAGDENNAGEENLYDTFNQGEYDAAEGKDVYRDALLHPYSVTVNTDGQGAVTADYQRTYPGNTVTLSVTSGTVASVTITDADGNNIALQGQASDGSNYWFTMPKKDVTAKVVFYDDNWATSGTGAENDPYIISTAEQWDRFAYNVGLGHSFSGQFLKLAADISVSSMAGRYYRNTDVSNRFSGTFDGDGHTLTFTASGQTEKFIAPFRCVGGNATIRNLKTAGSISSNNMYATGLIASIESGSTAAVENCRSSMAITNSGSGELTLSGLVGRLEDASLTISGCVFDGSLAGRGTTGNAGFVSWTAPNSNVTIVDCLFAPADISTSTDLCATIARKDDNASAVVNITNCYYTQALGTEQGTQSVAYSTIPAGLGDPVRDYGMVKAYNNGILSDGTYYGTPATITLADNADNSTTISNANGYAANVTLSGRTLYKDGAWNTLCLPFEVSDFTGTIFADAEVMTLGNSEACNTGFDSSTGTLNLEFVQADEIEPGVAYIVRWTKPDGYDDNPSSFDITSPVFSGVTIENEDPADHAIESGDGSVQFLGTYSPVSIYTDEKTNLYLGAGNTLYYPTTEGFQVNACRAYFQLKQGLTAGDPNAAVRAFVLNFGDETSGIVDAEANSSLFTLHSSLNEWYTLDGRKLDGKPTQRGIYIDNGKKVVIK